MRDQSDPEPRNSLHSWTPMSIVITTAVVAFIATLTARVLSGNVRISFATFAFNDLLTLILAVFSIGLSVSFFQQANNVSNVFYDNIYKFTQDVSVILGRIEAGFGERLRHLDEGYEGLELRSPAPLRKRELRLANKRVSSNGAQGNVMRFSTLQCSRSFTAVKERLPMLATKRRRS
jgi:hypothetical protein